MACGLDPDASAEECAIKHWCGALGVLRRERNKQWRADCPVPGCGARRALEFDAPGRHVRWKSFCGEHDKDAVRPHLAKIIGPCMAAGQRVGPIRHAAAEALALSGLPPLALKVQLLIYAGNTITEAFDKLGVDRTTRYRVRSQLSRYGDNAPGRRV